jgi:hypothetical protein
MLFPVSSWFCNGWKLWLSRSADIYAPTVAQFLRLSSRHSYHILGSLSHLSTYPSRSHYWRLVAKSWSQASTQKLAHYRLSTSGASALSLAYWLSGRLATQVLLAPSYHLHFSIAPNHDFNFKNLEAIRINQSIAAHAPERPWRN